MRVLARVPSLSTLGGKWDILDHRDGPACTCPRFEFSREKECSHTAIYRAARHAVERCAEAGHDASSGDENEIGLAGHYALCQQCLVELLAASAMKVRRRYVAKEKVAEIKEAAKAKVKDVREKAKARRKKR